MKDQSSISGYAPEDYARTLFNIVETGGTAIVSTPCHGYLKNLALAPSGKMDRHFTALWGNGQSKFWSNTTLDILLTEASFQKAIFHRVGRIQAMANSMSTVAEKPVT